MPDPRDWCVLLALAGGWLLFLGPALLSDKAPVFRDLLHSFYPWRFFISESLRSGELPEWYPFEGLGEPFIGQIAPGVFHPFSLVYLLLTLLPAVKFEIGACYFASLGGQFTLCRMLGTGRLAGTLGALGYAFSGYALSMHNNLTFLRGVAALPWLGCCAVKLLSSERPGKWVLLSALCWASILLGGDLQTYLMAGVVVLALAFAVDGLRRLPLLLAAGVLSLLLSAVELLPGWIVRANSHRASWEDIEHLSSVWSLHPARLPEFLFGGWLPRLGQTAAAHFLIEQQGVWATSIYAGPVILFLAGLCVALPGRRHKAMLALAIVGVWLALGVHGGLEPLTRVVFPLLNTLRFPEKYLVVWTLGITACAALGVQQLLEHGELVPQAAWRAGILGAILLVFFFGLTSPRFGSAFLERIAVRMPPEEIGERLLAAWRSGALAASLGLLAIAAVLAGSSRQRAAMALLVPLHVGLAWTIERDAIPLAEQSVLLAEPSLCRSVFEAGGGPGLSRIYSALSEAEALPLIDAQRAGPWAWSELNLLHPNTSGLCGLESTTDADNLPGAPERFGAVMGNRFSAGLASLYNYGFVVGSSGENGLGERVTKIDSLGYVLYRQPAAPRAFAGPPRWASGPREALSMVVSRPRLAAASPVLEGEPPDLLFEPPRPGVVEIVSYASTRVALRASLESPSAVVLNDLNYPGWTAVVDGAPAKVYSANYLARAVLVAAGSHEIVFSYETPNLRLGMAISLLTLFISVALAFCPIQKKTAG